MSARQPYTYTTWRKKGILTFGSKRRYTLGSIGILLLIVTALAVIPPVHAISPSLVTNAQSANFVNVPAAGGTLSVSISNVVAGNVIFATVFDCTANNPPTGSWSFSDGQSGIYSSVLVFTSANGCPGPGTSQTTFKATIGSTASSLTVTATMAAGSFSQLGFLSVEQWTNFAAIGATGHNECTASCTATTTSITTLKANSVLLGYSFGFTTPGNSAGGWSGTNTPTITFNQVTTGCGGADCVGSSAQESTTTTQSYSITSTYTGVGASYAYVSVIELDPPPAISSITPIGGSNGQSITITGTSFNGATKITFCGDTQPVFTVVSDTSITTFAPVRTPQTTGETCDILVTTSTGTSAASNADQFTYNPATTGGGTSSPAPFTVPYWVVLTILGTVFLFAVAGAVAGRRKP